MRDGLRRGSDDRVRCWWCGDDPMYVAYHDEEWGRPCDDEVLAFEHLCLEGFQAGLSWLVVLRKREAFRKAFRGWNVERVARMGERDVERLMLDASIVRNRAKIVSALNNARRTLALVEDVGSLSAHLASFAPGRRRRPRTKTDLATTSPEAQALSRDLKLRGFTFVGPTGTYALMQSLGIIDDHLAGCWRV